MRIIAGKYRGRHIVPPSNLRARPTTDFAREGLFNILANRIDFEEITVLDLFSGTGSISFEFASRGARLIHLVDSNPRHIAGIRKIIGELKEENIVPILDDVRRFIAKCSTKYNIIFADPPYDLPWLAELPDLVTGSGLLKEDGLFILEHPGSHSFTKNKMFLEQRNYGSVNFSFFRAGQAGNVIPL